MMSYDYPHPVSRTYQYKKITKPLLERKRRARINRCLDELKDLMVDALETEGENISKLEKADILELTVRHLQRLHASRPSGLSSKGSISEDASTAENRWQSGFGHCAAEACRYLAALPGESGEKLARHLASGLQTTRRKSVPVQGVPARENVASPVILDLGKTEIFPESRTKDLLARDSEMEVDSRIVESPRYSLAPEAPENPEVSKTPPIVGIRIYEHPSIDLKGEKMNEISSPVNISSSSFITTTVVKTIEGKNTRNDDEEEIDVEGVDEGDPMWRPW